MPNEVIERVHRLEKTAENGGIVFTNMQGNVLEDQMDKNQNDYNETEEDINNIHKEQSTNQSGQDLGSTGSNESDETEMLGGNQVDIKMMSMMTLKWKMKNQMSQRTESLSKTST